MAAVHGPYTTGKPWAAHSLTMVSHTISPNGHLGIPSPPAKPNLFLQGLLQHVHLGVEVRHGGFLVVMAILRWIIVLTFK